MSEWTTTQRPGLSISFIAAVLDAYSKTAGRLGTALGHYGSACSRLAFLQRHPQLPKDAGLRDACGNAFVLAQQELAEARQARIRTSLPGRRRSGS